MVPVALGVVATLAYILGSIPTGYLIGKLAGRDILRHGSRRTGATNVLRIGGWKAAGTVALVDLTKGALAVLGARGITSGDPTGDLLAGLFAMLGHNYSPFIGFKGGRGVAVGAAATTVMVPAVAPIAIFLFVSAIAVTRYISLGSILAALSVPLTLSPMVALQVQPPQHLLFGIAAAALVLFSHRDNIARLRSGTERRLGETSNNL